jgi:hypothetical protein
MNNIDVTKQRPVSKATDTEDTVERHFCKRVKSLKGLTFKLPPLLWGAGLPDRICLMPGGRVAFAELKRPKGGRYEPLQRWWLKRLTRLGFVAVTLRTKEAVDDFLEDLCSRST